MVEGTSALRLDPRLTLVPWIHGLHVIWLWNPRALTEQQAQFLRHGDSSQLRPWFRPEASNGFCRVCANPCAAQPPRDQR